MAMLEIYKEQFESLAAHLRAASSSSITQDLKQELVDECAEIEFNIKRDIQLLLDQFTEIKDAQLIITATFLGMARDVMHMIAFKIIGCYKDFTDLQVIADGSLENVIFATTCLIYDRDGKNIMEMYENE